MNIPVDGNKIQEEWVREDPLIGRQLANYAIEREIGRGGMAVVYFGRDVRLNRPAAIKVIDARFRDQSSYTGRFLQEARVVASWRHEHILQIYYADDQQVAELGQVFFFAMEYIDGQNLAEELAGLVQTHGSVPPADVLRCGRAIAEALDYAHARGVIHRDVKPANILVSTDGRIVLSDFGLALEMQQGSIGEVFGSAHYIAPEQARRSSDALPQSDLYSLGVILYEMLTGVVPFDDPSPTSVALQHITLPPPRPRDINPDLSEEVEAVLMKALAKQPADRYGSGMELMSALENALIRMHPSLPTHKNYSPLAVPLPTAGDTAARAAYQPFPKSFPAISTSTVKIAIAAGGLALIACLVISLSILAWQNGRAKPAQVAPGAVSTSVALSGQTEPAALAPLSTATQPSGGGQTPLPVQPTTAAEAPTEPAGTPVPAALVNEPPSQPTPTWTPKYAGGRKMILSWNESSFYMRQVTGYGEVISPVVFERLNAEGVPVNRFSGKQWAELHEATLRDWCMRLEIDGPSQPASQAPYLRPAHCEDHYLASRWPASGDQTIFWTRQEGSRQFRVLWGRDEIQRCEIDAGACEVFLP